MPFTIERCYKLKAGDLEDLCHATDAAIQEGIGFNWVTPPPREMLEKYWKGVLVVPERELFIARLDGAVAGAVQLVKPGRTRESMAFAVSVQDHFVAPWARGHGMAKALLAAAEEEAHVHGFTVVKLSVRETQQAAITLYESMGYHCWGTLPKHEKVGGHYIGGKYYFKELTGAEL
jgi:ribosomal protein S18 acetylase RimI-like enzyme